MMLCRYVYLGVPREALDKDSERSDGGAMLVLAGSIMMGEPDDV
jgi:hypothetical protein